MTGSEQGKSQASKCLRPGIWVCPRGKRAVGLEAEGRGGLVAKMGSGVGGHQSQYCVWGYALVDIVWGSSLWNRPGSWEQGKQSKEEKGFRGLG